MWRMLPQLHHPLNMHAVVTSTQPASKLGAQLQVPMSICNTHLLISQQLQPRQARQLAKACEGGAGAQRRAAAGSGVNTK